ncbi:MAG: glycosyltransferase family 4 protein [Alphaproteobacteria bacterium]|nr:glycosyltransferase family 4 protein [Alphaproteobacteria bacterium]
MKTALVHEWLDSYAGSERVLEQLLLEWPEADVFAVCDFMPEAERGFLQGKPITTSFIQKMPFARKHFRKFLGLMPLAIELLDLSAYDVVISSSHAVAKGVLTGPGQLHISYVHSPMRYAWDLQHQYLREAGLTRGLKGAYTRWLLHRMRLWDRSSALNPDIVLANSSYIAERIQKTWRCNAQVLHPPVDIESFTPAPDKSDYYLIASRIVPYKRVDLIAAAFRAMPKRKLIIVGDGPNEAQARAAAGDAPNITFKGRLPRAELIALTQGARAAVFAAEEDFGITTVEAQACGTPVIAYGRGGARDIVVAPPDARPTGIFFQEQTTASLIAAVERFEAMAPAISPGNCRANAERFSNAHFRSRFRQVVHDALGIAAT